MIATYFSNPYDSDIPMIATYFSMVHLEKNLPWQAASSLHHRGFVALAALSPALLRRQRRLSAALLRRAARAQPGGNRRLDGVLRVKETLLGHLWWFNQQKQHILWDYIYILYIYVIMCVWNYNQWMYIRGCPICLELCGTNKTMGIEPNN
jgi:hypothetical protein